MVANGHVDAALLDSFISEHRPVGRKDCFWPLRRG
jgi:hypothetical protein